jgi:hypothetical protein
MNVFKNGKENMGPSNYPLTNSVSSITPTSVTDRISVASDTNGGNATSTPGEEDDSSGNGISDLELGNVPSDTAIPPSAEKSKKKNSHRRLGSFGVRPNEDGRLWLIEILKIYV